MISSFFEKSKPINIVIVTFIISIMFVAVKFQYVLAHFSWLEIFQQIDFWFLAVFSVFILDFIISKNNLTRKNSYAILLFGLFITLFPQSISQHYMLLSNIFILFALRRLISLHSKVDIKKKIFDAAFWIALATLCYFWSILFLIVLIIALLYHSQNDIKNWIIPGIGLMTVAILMFSFNIVYHDKYFIENTFNTNLSFDFSIFNNLQSIISITLFFSLLIWTLIYFIKSIKQKTKRFKPSYIFIAISAIIALTIVIISPIKSGGEFIFLFAPLAIIMANYLENLKEKWFREVLILVLFVLPIVFLVL